MVGGIKPWPVGPGALGRNRATLDIRRGARVEPVFPVPDTPDSIPVERECDRRDFHRLVFTPAETF